jgi:hypothetical protein
MTAVAQLGLDFVSLNPGCPKPQMERGIFQAPRAVANAFKPE